CRYEAVLISRLQTIKDPTLIIHGEEDEEILIQDDELIAREIPNARFYRIPNAGLIKGVRGCQPFTRTDSIASAKVQSKSIFFISDTRIVSKAQITMDIIALLRQTYGQQPNVSLEEFSK
ncbi:14092_t:CDS:2, partial [Cetraspora pellucida]